MNVKTFQTRTLIRASKHCKSHIDIFKQFIMQEVQKMPEDEKIGKSIDCPGGGMLKINKNKYKIYGESR